MTKQNSKKRTVLTVMLGSMSSIALGWALNKFGKEPIQKAYFGMNQKVKETTNQWYEDGRQKAQDFQTIKMDIESEL